MSTPRIWTVTFTEMVTHRVVVTIPGDVPEWSDGDEQAAFLLDLARDAIGDAGDVVVSSAARLDMAEPGGTPATAPGRSAWAVVRSHPGMPFSEENPRRSGYNSTPCPLEEAENAVGSVGDENVYERISSIAEAFRIAVENHPDRDGDTDIAAYIIDENDGTYTVAV